MGRYRLELKVIIYDGRDKKVKVKHLSLDELDELEDLNRQVFSDMLDLQGLIKLDYTETIDDMIQIEIKPELCDFISNIVLDFNNPTDDIETLSGDIMANLSDGWGENDRPFGEKHFYKEDNTLVDISDIQTEDYRYEFICKTFPPIKEIEDKYGLDNLELVTSNTDDELKDGEVLYLDTEEISRSSKSLRFSDRITENGKKVIRYLTDDEKVNVKAYNTYYRPKRPKNPDKNHIYRKNVEQDPLFNLFRPLFVRQDYQQTYYRDTNEIVTLRHKYTVLYDLKSLTKLN